jgi:hypothetical protein
MIHTPRLCLWQGSFDDEFDDGYGSDLMGDEEDREKLMAMDELAREMILAERAEKRDEERERLRNAKMIKQREQAAKQVKNGLVVCVRSCAPIVACRFHMIQYITE